MTTEKPNPMLHVPNLITGGRLLAVPVTVWLILSDHLTLAFWLFMLAAVSDGLDGMIARLFRARSKLGAWLDPLADKALLVGCFVAMATVGLVPLWLVALILLRDITIILGLAVLLVMLRERLSIQPLWVGKLNTALQLALAALILAVYGARLAPEEYVLPAELLVAATTLWSMVAYVLRGLFILRTRDAGDDAGDQSGDAA
ncbi:CDP-alcohol phosphatidyltransferase family protein [Niveispirillum sp. BGYR6]|uniref:CDP-alcohol phosphatidyltransferase family protein n=1 Tax=Niveispirillum sp. BGYR6 TaxID=2971249 RepID=UPI0022B95BE6|nr:CDP-alcohol phosphatidyltransferase family protein [Niveispirillum sp. BGYR6]MDG5494516.1 CDP-alcohol phosphatidyltransferase family protein [Niveispirillum sp. BGYR6]